MLKLLKMRIVVATTLTLSMTWSAQASQKCLRPIEVQGLAIFKKNCDKCTKDLVSVENAFKECVERTSSSGAEIAVVVGIVGLVGGFFIGKGLR
jgi:hypothetical protein